MRSDQVKRWILDAGFSHVGIAPAHALCEAEAQFLDAIGEVVFVFGSVCQDLKPKACGDACGCHACVAESDDAHFLAVELEEVVVEVAEVG